MATAINILIVEDSPADALLVVEELKSAGFEPKWKRVETEADYLAGLKDSPHLIIADYTMPQFAGLRAMDLLGERGLDIPLILISGTVGEEKAVEAMQHGVTDYLLKDRIGRLGNAVERALEQKRLRAERKRMEQQMALQATALETAANAIIMTDQKGVILWVNPAFTALTGYTAEEILGKTPRVLKSGKHDQKFYHDFWQTITSGKTWRSEFINRHKDGSIYYDEHTVTPVRSQAGEITHFIGIMNDVTERKRAEEELRAAHAQLRQLLDHSPAVIYALKVEGENVFPYIVSENITRLLGFSVPETLRYEWWVGQLHPQDRDMAIASVAETFTHGTSRTEYRLRHKNGDYHWVEDQRRIIYGPSDQPADFAGVWTDITERKQLEEQLRQSQKMEAIGQLAGGVAHDFNNILAAIVMQAYLAATTPNLPAETREWLDEIKVAAERAASLTRQLLAFSRRQVMQPCQLDVNESVTSLARMLQRIMGEDLRLQLNLHARPLLTHADAGMLDQVLMNLVVNARDAMPDGGVLSIETAEKVFTKTEAASIPNGSPGRHVCLRVTDTGSGIAPENLARIFEPFFTTKGPGEGTGLGLATVFGIVKQHGGSLMVESEVGKGTTFQIFLRAEEATDQSRAEKAARPEPRGGTETILIAEDETVIRLVIRAVLERVG